jgi:hypothetical protein
MRRLGVVLFSLLVGCSAPAKHDTNSGRPEVTISGTTKAKVGSYLIGKMLDWQCNLSSQSESQLVFHRPSDAGPNPALFGSRTDRPPHLRITYTLVDTGGSVRVVGDLRTVDLVYSYDLSERQRDFNRSPASRQVQALLDQMTQSLTG